MQELIALLVVIFIMWVTLKASEKIFLMLEENIKLGIVRGLLFVILWINVSTVFFDLYERFIHPILKVYL